MARNWMLFQAYEAAERGDFEPVRGMLDMLCRPYEEQSCPVNVYTSSNMRMPKS